MTEMARARSAVPGLLESLEDWQREQMGEAVEDLRQDLRAGSPVDSGDFRDDWSAFSGRPSGAEDRGRSGRSVVRDWRPGQDIGVENNKPYARRLAFHRWSKQVSRQWIDRIVAAFRRRS